MSSVPVEVVEVGVVPVSVCGRFSASDGLDVRGCERVSRVGVGVRRSVIPPGPLGTRVEGSVETQS